MPLLDPNHLSSTGQRIMPSVVAPIDVAPTVAELYDNLKLLAERSITSRREWLATPLSEKVD